MMLHVRHVMRMNKGVAELRRVNGHVLRAPQMSWKEAIICGYQARLLEVLSEHVGDAVRTVVPPLNSVASGTCVIVNMTDDTDDFPCSL